MPRYKCGWCGKYNEGDIWCSEVCREAWYVELRFKVAQERLGEGKRRGPRHAGVRKRKKRLDTGAAPDV